MYFKVIAPGVETPGERALRNLTYYYISGIVLFVVLLGGCILIALGMNKGAFVYPLDDTYIHMTIAKNLALHGTWGLDPENFASASSSILYTLLLSSAFYITGISDFTPLILNVIASLLIISYFYTISKSHQVHPVWFALALLLLIVGVSIIPLTMSGMEHTWQILIGLVFIYEAARYMESKKKALAWKLLFLSALAVMVRYEGIFLVGIVSFIMLLRGQILQAVLVLVAGMIPVVLFGMYSIAEGAYFFPNSVLLKGQSPELNIKGIYLFSVSWMIKLIENPHLLGIFGLLVILFLRSVYYVKNHWKLESIIIWILVCLFIAHLTFAKTGWFYRYEAYLLAFSFFAFMLIGKEIYPEVKDLLQRKFVLKVRTLLVLLALALLSRGVYTIRNTPMAMNNIYSQQYQMAAFISNYNPELSVLAHDIGVISYYNNIHLLDFFGLANLEVLDLKRDDNFTQAKIEELANREHIELAIIYNYDLLPKSWIKIGGWTIKNNVVCESKTVGFYLVDITKKNQAIAAFNKHVLTLPEDVIYESNF